MGGIAPYQHPMTVTMLVIIMIMVGVVWSGILFVQNMMRPTLVVADHLIPSPPPPVRDANPHRVQCARDRLAVVRDEWLDYDRDVELLVSCPAMRNFEVASTVACLDALERAEVCAHQVMNADDEDRLVALVGECEVALREAVLFARIDAQRGMGERERSLLLRAKRALAIALDGGATAPERNSAYQVVQTIMTQLGSPVPEPATGRVHALIEPGQVPVAELTSAMVVRTPEVIVAGLPGPGPDRRTYVLSRVGRMGEVEVRAVAALAEHAATVVFDQRDADRARTIRGVLREHVSVLSVLATCDEPDVAQMARSRLDDLGEAITVCDQLLAVCT